MEYAKYILVKKKQSLETHLSRLDFFLSWRQREMNQFWEDSNMIQSVC